MKMQLVDLMSLQELDSRLDELGRVETQQQEDGRGSSLKETSRLRAERSTITRSLRPELLRYYERVRKRHSQAVVRTSYGTCLGCFTLRPTSMTYGGKGFETCERCGRILIRFEEGEASSPPVRVEERARGKSRG